MQLLLHRDDDGPVNFDTQLLVSENETIAARLRQAAEDVFADPAPTRRGGG